MENRYDELLHGLDGWIGRYDEEAAQAIRDLLAVCVWQPIATAPKEHGVEILVCEPGRTMAVVEWLSAHIVDDDDFISGWYISDGHNDPIWYRNHPNVTHWMPLPSPPTPATIP